ncbi:MAG: pyridoxal phosphate-dependent aminotransferase [Abitibacteriaceae bacterium]|nr:pyridoxal phosphate-dependent aminotransferase [Abditibacteriaceae bacterium]MBV9865210.1 pyridoxal phosphate-dependent aminotransferase [Abditibacteriaceae bacterium]
MLSERINRIQPSPTLTISAKAKAMRAAGEDVISFDVGEPDFDTPEHIKEACIRALRDGDTKYTAAAGTPQLREAICRKLKRENKLEYAPDQIVVSCGGKHSLYNIFQSILNPGDEVIIPAPYWVSYPDQVLLADGVPVFIQASQEQGFKITPQQLADCLKAHPRAKAIVINSPSNPTGAVYPPAALRELCQVLENYPNVLIISDEVYEHMVYAPNQQWSVASYNEEFQARTILVHSFSKTYSMTGWRLGWTSSSKELASAMAKLQSQSTSNPTSFAQAGGVAALDGPINTDMLGEFEHRGKVIRELLKDVPGFTCIRPEGAFYAFPKVDGIFGVMVDRNTQINSASDLAAYLLRAAKVAVVPGEGFGAPAHLRFSYATSEHLMKEGINRILQVLPE